MNGNCQLAELKPEDFHRICEAVYSRIGIRLADGKEELVRSRLMKRLRALGIDGFDKYLAYVNQEGSEQELDVMINLLTTNKTSFFREPVHFEFMSQKILPSLRLRKSGLRIWSAGCSSGEEPYSIALLIAEEWPDFESRDVRILATDVSTRVLAVANAAEYDIEALRELPPGLLQRHFVPSPRGRADTRLVHQKIRGIVRFARLNLMEPWPMRGPFDVIFCRNVMIYFDRPTQKSLVQRFWQLLGPGGHLFVGHSESLVTSSHQYKYVQPAIYMK